MKKSTKCYYCGKGIGKKRVSERENDFHPKCYQRYLRYGEVGRKGFYS